MCDHIFVVAWPLVFHNLIRSLMAKFLLKQHSLPPNSVFGVNPAPTASMKKAAQRRLEGLLRKVARADEGGETKGVFWSPLPSPGGACGGGGGCHDETREWKAALRWMLLTLPTMMALLSWGAFKLASSPEFSRPVLNRTDLILGISYFCRILHISWSSLCR